MAKSLLKVSRVYKLTDGSILAQALTTSWSDGTRLKLEAVTDFDADGGEFVLEPGTAREELALYSGVNEQTDELTGVTRPNTKYAHAIGTFVQEGAEATVEKYADGTLDDEETPAVAIPIPSHIAPYFQLGARDDGETVWVDVSEEGELETATAAVGAIPTFDEDGEVIAPGPIITIVEETTPGIIETNVPPLVETIVTPIGLGDDAVPANPVGAPSVIKTVKTNVVDMRSYTIPTDWVAFEVQRSTDAVNWSTLGQSGSLYVDNNVSYGTTYYYRYAVLDSEGNKSAYSPASSGDQPSQAGTADLTLRSVTADVLAATITLSTLFRTAGSGARVEFDSSGIRLYDSGGNTTANLSPSTGIATLYGAVYRSSLSTAGARVEIDSNGLRLYNSGGTATAQLSTSTGVASLYGAIYRSTVGATGSRVEIDSNGLRFYDSGGNVKVNLDAATGAGSFAGALNGATGTFSGDISGASGTFSGSLNATGSISGATVSSTASGGVVTRLDSGGVTFDGATDSRIYSTATVTVSEMHLTGTRVFVDANLYHTGSTLGFYGVSPTTRISMTNLSGSDSTTAALHSKVNNLLDNLRTIGLIS